MTIEPLSDRRIPRPRERHLADRATGPFAFAALAACVLLAAIPLLAGCGPQVVDDPALMGKVAVVLAKAKVDGAVHDVVARTDGSISITLNATKQDIGDEAKALGAAKSISALVFKQVPEIKRVSVFDGNDEIIDILSPNGD